MALCLGTVVGTNVVRNGVMGWMMGCLEEAMGRIGYGMVWTQVDGIDAATGRVTGIGVWDMTFASGRFSRGPGSRF